MAVALLCHADALVFRPECWRAVAAAYEVPHVFVRGAPGPLRGFVADGPEHQKPGRLVCLVHLAEAPANVELHNLVHYEHPVEATYAFGPDDAVRGWADDFERVEYVYVPTPGGTQLHSFVAAALVLHDRMVKRGDH